MNPDCTRDYLVWAMRDTNRPFLWLCYQLHLRGLVAGVRQT